MANNARENLGDAIGAVEDREIYANEATARCLDELRQDIDEPIGRDQCLVAIVEGLRPRIDGVCLWAATVRSE